MTKHLEENHIDLPEFARGWERKQGSGKPEHAFSTWVKQFYDIYVSDGSISDLPSDISESEASIPSLEVTPINSPKLSPKTSHFLLVSDESSDSYFTIQLDISHSDYKGDI